MSCAAWSFGRNGAPQLDHSVMMTKSEVRKGIASMRG